MFFFRLCALLIVSGLSACTGFFFYPDNSLRLTPDLLGIDYEDVFLSSDQERVHAWFLPAQGEELGQILFLHGNAENISSHIRSVYWLPALGYSVLLLDYRGYGRSSGKPSIAGVQRDAAVALDYLLSRAKARDVGEVRESCAVVFGQSLGAAVASVLVAESSQGLQVKALILDSAFSDYREIAREKLEQVWLTYPVSSVLSRLFSSSFSPQLALGKIAGTPVLLLHGTGDEIVPYHHSERLYQGALEPKELWLFEGRGHIQALGEKEVRQRFLDYLGKVCRGVGVMVTARSGQTIILKEAIS